MLAFHRYADSKHRFLRPFAVFVACLIGMAMSLRVDAASMAATPAQGADGTHVRISAQGLAVSAGYTLEFAGTSTTTLATLTSDTRGVLKSTLTLPALAAGNGKLRLRSTALGTPVVAYTGFTVLAGLSFTPDMTNVHAGQSLPFTVQGLQSGTLSVRYDGQLVIGPVATGAGQFRGKFVLPKDHPANLPQNVDVLVENRSGRIVLNALHYNLPVQAALRSPFDFSIGTPAPNQTKPSQRFTVGGTITRGDNEPPVDDVSLWFYGDNGDVYPLGSATLADDSSSYTMTAAGAGLSSMTAGQPSAGHSEFIARGQSNTATIVNTKVNQDNPAMQPLQDDRWRVTIRVVKVSGDPIPGALVTFLAPTLEPADPNDDGLVFSAYSQFQNIGFAQATQYPTIGVDQYGCALTLQNVHADSNGYASFEITDDALRGSIVISGPDLGDVGIPEFDLIVDASAQGYGYQREDGTFLKHIYRVYFDGLDLDPQYRQVRLYNWYDPVDYADPVATGSDNFHYTLALGAIEPRIGIVDINILPWNQQTASIPTSATGNLAVSGPSFGPVFNRPPVLNPAWVHEGVPGDMGYPTQVTVRIDRAQSGRALQGQLFLDLNRDGTPEQVSAFSLSPDSIDCDSIDDGGGTLDDWVANLPDLRNQAPGTILGYVQFAGGGHSAKQYLQIQIKELPTWIAGENYSGQDVGVRNGWQAAQIDAVENSGSTALQLDSDPGYSIGYLHNSTDNTRSIHLELPAGGATTVSAPLLGEHEEAGHRGSDTAVAPEGNNSYHSDTTLLDQSFPLFFYTWGIPSLAGVTAGANLDILAKIVIDGSYVLNNEDNPVLDLITTPILDLGVDVYVDLDVLFDLVDAQVHLLPGFSLSMPVEVVDGVKQDSDECFRAYLDFQYTISFFCLPFDPICNAINDFSGHDTLVDDYSPNGCRIPSRAVVSSGTPQSLLLAHSALAFDGFGNGWMAFLQDDSGGALPRKLIVRGITGGVYDRADNDVALSDAPGIRSIEIAFYDENRAIAVWAENADDYATMAARAPEQRVARQHLMYAQWDGENWSAKNTLTPVSGGEGGVALAACMAAAKDCPRAGEVLAVWTRDINGKISDHHTQVFQSRFLPARGWIAPQSVDSSALLDSSPSAAYAGGKPVVAFVRNATGVFAQTKERTLAYRFLDGTSDVQVPAGLPTSVAWPSLQGLANGDIALAYTHADDAKVFVGNTQRLAVARGTRCSFIACTITGRDLNDAHGRAIYAEHPRLLLDAAGDPTVVYRGVGYGNILFSDKNHLAGDPIGIALHTGELMQARFDLAQGAAQPVAISSDGAGHLAPNAAIDPSLDQLVVVSSTVAPVDAQRQQSYAATGLAPPRAAATAIAVGNDMAVHGVARGVDFAIDAVDTGAVGAVTGVPMTVDVAIANRGAPYSADGLWKLRLDWDGPGSAGDAITSRALPSLASGETTTLSFTFAPTSGFDSDQTHHLYATLEPAPAAVADIDGDNNALFTTVGGMPQPQNLRTALAPAGGFIFLSWDASTDARVKGHRIWKQDEGGKWQHLGSSYTRAFMDLSPPAGKQRSYRITSYSIHGIESEPSAVASATPIPTDDGIFRNGFE